MHSCFVMTGSDWYQRHLKLLRYHWYYNSFPEKRKFSASWPDTFESSCPADCHCWESVEILYYYIARQAAGSAGWKFCNIIVACIVHQATEKYYLPQRVI